tara:strand:+ start:328 stop:465 length:138 start_codon:yes stop_codon:yes gene_type:complete
MSFFKKPLLVYFNYLYLDVIILKHKNRNGQVLKENIKMIKYGNPK